MLFFVQKIWQVAKIHQKWLKLVIDLKFYIYNYHATRVFSVKNNIMMNKEMVYSF
jgi:hypothetical protein